MPIKGFAERKRMRRVGIVRLGIKLISERTGHEYPRATDYFVLDDAPGLAEIYGEQARLLNILMVSDDPEIAFPYYMMRYRQRGLVCMGDGDHILRRRGQPIIVRENGEERTTYPWEVLGGVNLKTGEIEPCRGLDCPHAIRPKNGRADCQPTGRLRFICADSPTHGYYQLTVRKRAIEGFLGQLAFARDILGRITGYPWQLILEQETVQLESGQRKLWIPQLQIEPAIFQELLRRKHRGEPLALPEGIREPTPEMDRELTEDLDYEPANGELPDEEEEPEPPAPNRKSRAKPDPDESLTGREFDRAMAWLGERAATHHVSPAEWQQVRASFNEDEPPTRAELNELVAQWKAEAEEREASEEAEAALADEAAQDAMREEEPVQRELQAEQEAIPF